MLEFIRQKSASTAVLFIFGIIILVFVFWGFNPGGPSATNNAVAIVNGNEVSARAYESLYKRELERVRSQVGVALTDEILESLNLRQRTLDMLINDILIIGEAKNRGFEASDKDVQAQILSNPVFQRDGVFNEEHYFQLLDQNRLKSGEYEAGLKDGLSAQKMLRSIIDGVAFTDDELWAEYEMANGKYTYNYIAFEPAAFIDNSAAPEEELKKFYDKNSSRFTVPTEVKLFYARAGFRAMGKKITVPDEEIEIYYKNNSYDFFREKEVKASHILIKPVKGDMEGARVKADGILKRLRAGESFAKLAGEYSQDKGSAKKGGNLGFFGLGSMVKQFEDSAFSLKKGEMSGLVKTSFGYHIIKVVDIEEEGIKPLAVVRGDIRDILIEAQAVFAATDSIEGLREAFESSTNLVELERPSVTRGLRPRRRTLSQRAEPGG
jgi:peptidyl-prolyl cis-trans isomerase D